MTDTTWEHAAEARAALNAIVTDPEHGAAALSSPQTMSNLLKDLLPDAPREKSILVAAAEAGLAGKLREHVDQGMDPDTAIRLAASSFSATTPFTPDACNWVTGELAGALGISQPVSDPAAGYSPPGYDPGGAPTRSVPIPGYVPPVPPPGQQPGQAYSPVPGQAFPGQGFAGQAPVFTKQDQGSPGQGFSGGVSGGPGTGYPPPGQGFGSVPGSVPGQGSAPGGSAPGGSAPGQGYLPGQQQTSPPGQGYLPGQAQTSAPGQGYPPPGQGYGPPGQGFQAPGQGFQSPGQPFQAPGQGFQQGPVAGFQPAGVPGYQQPGYAGQRRNGMALAAMILGIAQFVLWFAFVIPGFLAAVAAIILGAVSLGQIKRTGEEGRGMAIAGIVLAVAGILIVVLLVVAGVVVANRTQTGA